MSYKIKISKLFSGLGAVLVLSLSAAAMEPIHFDDRNYYTGSEYADGDAHPRSRYKGKKGNYTKHNKQGNHRLASYDYPQFDNDVPYYFHKGLYYYGGDYDKGIYRHGKHKFRGGHYYSRGYRYYKGKRYNVRDGRYGYYKNRYTYRDSRRYRKLRAKMRRLDRKIDDAKRRYHLLLDKREHFRRRHNL